MAQRRSKEGILGDDRHDVRRPPDVPIDVHVSSGRVECTGAVRDLSVSGVEVFPRPSLDFSGTAYSWRLAVTGPDGSAAA